MATLEAERSLLEDGLLQNGHSWLYTRDGSVDINGKPVLKQNTGNWKACFFILGTEGCERLAFFGISTNLVTYLTKKMHEGNVSAARNVTIWQGTCYLTPLLGAALADACCGRYWTIAASSMIYVMVITKQDSNLRSFDRIKIERKASLLKRKSWHFVPGIYSMYSEFLAVLVWWLPLYLYLTITAMCALTLSASVPALRPADCIGSVCPSATVAQYTVFFFGLYLVALGMGGIKPCVAPFGADQFDDTDLKERVKKGSFFNWYYFSIYLGILISSTFLVWIQDNVGWGLGFGVSALFMGIAVVGFLFGTPRYRFQMPRGSPITRVFQVLVAACRKWNLKVPRDSSVLFEIQDDSFAIEGSYKLEHSATLKFLDKAAVISDAEISSGDLTDPWRLCTVTQVEEVKILIHLLPIWATGIVFSAVYAQVSTTFVEQGTMMDTTVGSFTVPPASLSTFDVVGVLSLLPIYDRLIIPMARKFTGKEKGISELQRMGIGLFISVLCMASAAVVEFIRLWVAKENHLVDQKVAVPLSILWQIPQYFLMGTSEIFMYVGQLEFFYEQSPDSMRSFCSALCLFTVALGYYLSSFILTIIACFTTEGGQGGWIPDNLNEGHLDYFFWIFAGLGFCNMLVYIVCAKKFKQRKASLRVSQGGIILENS